MNGKLAKKLRQLTKRKWRDFYDDILKQPFKVRFRIAWFIITHRIKEKKCLSKKR